MSTFPQLEDALEAAARRHYGRRRRRFSWRPFVPAVAVAAAATAAVLTLPHGSSPPAPDRPPAAAVPALTLARSHALTQVPGPARPIGRTRVAHADLPAVAAEIRRSIPYPPGLEDRFDWAATPPGPYDMSSINFREEVQMMVEFRAGCLWLQFWLAADAPGRSAAAAVLADIPEWPYQRNLGGGSRWPQIAAAAARGDVATLTTYERGECAGM